MTDDTRTWTEVFYGVGGGPAVIHGHSIEELIESERTELMGSKPGSFIVPDGRRHLALRLLHEAAS